MISSYGAVRASQLTVTRLPSSSNRQTALLWLLYGIGEMGRFTQCETLQSSTSS